jgi:hypothetical protein
MRRLIWLPFLLAASPAHAHSSMPGIKGFYVGLVHPFSTPSQAVAMLGLGLLAGGFVAPRSGWMFGTFLAFGLFGIAVGVGPLDLDTGLFAAAFLSCALAALAPGRVVLLAIALTAVGAHLIGAASVPDPGPARDRVITMAGSLVGANLGLLYLWGAVHVARTRIPWSGTPIALRVVAAWIGAIALLMLSLGLAIPAQS